MFAVIIYALGRQTSAPIELAFVAPLTSQSMTFTAIIRASRDLPNGSAKRLAEYLLISGYMLVSLLLLGLSLGGTLPRLLYTQCGLFILSLSIAFRPKEPESRLSIPLAYQPSRRDIYRPLNTDSSLVGVSPPPNAHI